MAPNKYYWFYSLKKTSGGCFKRDSKLQAAVIEPFERETLDCDYTGVELLIDPCNSCIGVRTDYTKIYKLLYFTKFIFYILGREFMEVFHMSSKVNLRAS